MSSDNKTPELDAPAQVCSRCGCVSPLAKLFRKAGRAGTLCPRCYVQHRQRQQRTLTIMVALAVAGLALYTLLALPAGLGPPYMIGNLLLILFAMYVSIVGHELAHALAGWLTGGQVYELRLGSGPDLVKLRRGELLLRIRRYLGGGACVVIYPSGREQRWRLVVLLAAGMLFHLLVIAACLPGFPHEDPWSMWAWRDALLIANVFLLVIPLFTRQALTQDGLVTTDAAQIWQLLTKPWNETERQAASYYALAVLSWQRADYVRAEAAARAGTEVAPNQPLAMHMVGLALLELGRPAEARAIFETLATSEMEAKVAEAVPAAESQAVIRAMNQNNLAYAMLMAQAHEPDLQRARELAEAAFAVMPWDANIEGTLGAVLVETGAVEAGLRHLEAAGMIYDTPSSQASNLAWRALGHHRMGQAEQAQALLQKATLLDGAHPGVQLITLRIQDPAPGSGADLV